MSRSKDPVFRQNAALSSCMEPRLARREGETSSSPTEESTRFREFRLPTDTESELARQVETLQRRVAERTLLAETRTAQLRTMAVQLTQTEHRERRRLARLLHEQLQQLLVAARLSTNLARRRTDDDESLRRLNQVDELLDESIEVSRSLARELSPPVLYDVGLIVALEWLVRHMTEKYELAVCLSADVASEPPDVETRVILFEAIRELLLNVARHSGSPHARVDLQVRDDRIEAAVSDEGRGFEPRGLLLDADAGGFGLFRIRQRLEVFGGSMELDSAPGRGAQISVSVPRRSEAGTTEGEPAPISSRATMSSVSQPEERSALMDHLRKIRVLLVDDHEIVREGLASLLLAEPDMEVVAEASDGLEALDLAQTTHPDVVLMDVTMPRLDGIEATRRLKAQMPHMRIIGLSMHEKDDMGQAMREAGAVAYLSKNGCADTLIGVIRQEAAGTGDDACCGP